VTATDVAGAAAPPKRWRRSTLVPGLAVVAAGLVAATIGHRLVPSIGVLTWAVALGVLTANVGLLPASARAAMAPLTRRLLRIGVALLGFSISLASIASLGLPVIGIVVVTLAATLLVTVWLSHRLRLGSARSLLIATGVAVCGASAIAAMQETAGADEEDVTAAIAMITLFGTISMFVLPLLRRPFGLSTVEYGVWAGASVHEVGQVVAAASGAGAAVLATAVVVKLTRVLLLAPVVAIANLVRRPSRPAGATRRPALIPLFVLGFIACAVVRTIGIVPAPALSWISTVQSTALGAALFGMGASVHLRSLVRRSAPLVAAAGLATLFVTGFSLAGVAVLVR
jgi:uncharacterized integral membrane protein (TIGR00698 family)